MPSNPITRLYNWTIKPNEAGNIYPSNALDITLFLIISQLQCKSRTKQVTSSTVFRKKSPSLGFFENTIGANGFRESLYGIALVFNVVLFMFSVSVLLWPYVDTVLHYIFLIINSSRRFHLFLIWPLKSKREITNSMFRSIKV